MVVRYEITSASMIGTHHSGRRGLAVGKNNQDASGWFQDEQCTVAVVCDGCGSGQHSEFGAHFGVQSLLKAFKQIFSPRRSSIKNLGPEALLSTVFSSVLSDLEDLIQLLSFSSIDDFKNYLLFSILGCYSTQNSTIIFSYGDGYYGINDRLYRIGPFPDNAPPYLAYKLLDSEDVSINNIEGSFSIEKIIPTKSVSHIFLGTDGVEDLISADGNFFPGRDQHVPSLKNIFKDDHYFTNPDALRRLCSKMNSVRITRQDNSSKFVWHEGLLSDDTTIILMRKNLDHDQ